MHINNINHFRDKNGIPHIEADNILDLYWGFGYYHAIDRGMQILLMRILGQGRLSELLDPSDNSLKIDKFFRRVNWSANVNEQIKKIPEKEKNISQAYCDGINYVFKKKIPWEYKLFNYKPDLWKIEDIILIARMSGYLTLSQSQEEMERFFIELVKKGVSEDKLKELFPEILEGLDIELIKKVEIADPIVSPEILWNIAIPRAMASNNWVISGKNTKSKKPILSSDPHLEVNRLPNVWSEISLKYKKRYMIGATMPGIPGVLIGRNNDLSWGATYTFMDSVDFWIEECENGRFKKEKKWNDFIIREEIIKRKKKESVKVIFYENSHGVLEGDPYKKGYYLSTKWSGSECGAQSLSQIINIFNTVSVKDGMDVFAKMEPSFNWVFADTKGNIGYQMSGLMPKRRKHIRGFIPLDGRDKKNDWDGFENCMDLPRSYNPEDGYFITANNDLNKYGKVKPITLPMGSYRAERIEELLKNKRGIRRVDIYKMHFDVYSLQAERFMKIIKHLLPDTKNGKILKNWDFKYDLNSQGAFIFEEFYRQLIIEVFGKRGFGKDIIKFIDRETGLFIDFYANFDRILLSENSLWFESRSRDDLFKGVLDKILPGKVNRWGKSRNIIMKNILFDGRLPKVFGFDNKPFELKGSRATISQGQIYRAAGRDTTFAPSYRLVTDMSKDEINTNMAGGPSDRRFSKFYKSDMKNWLDGIYKIIKPEKNL